MLSCGTMTLWVRAYHSVHPATDSIRVLRVASLKPSSGMRHFHRPASHTIVMVVTL